MGKKCLLVLVLAILISGALGAQEEQEVIEAEAAASTQPLVQEEVKEPNADSDEPHKHEQFDMLLGLNYGMGISPNFLRLYGQLISDNELTAGNFAMIYYLGLTYDVYLLNWLSINTGMIYKLDIYVLLDQRMESEDIRLSDIAAFPVCLTIPLGAHVNIPHVEWLYLGMGLEINLPLFALFGETIRAASDGSYDPKGDPFIGMPIDFGFDFMRPGSGGMRLFFRVMPEFHKYGTAVPVGIVWQIWNWKLNNKN